MKHTKKILGATLALVTLGTATAAWAGYRWPFGQVVVDTAHNTATGVLGAARSSADNVQYIMCGVHATSTGGAHVVCQAEDANGVQVQCQSSNGYLLQAAASITSVSQLHFSWDSTGTCTNLDVNNSSSNPPMQP